MSSESLRLVRRPFPAGASDFLAAYVRGDERLRPLYASFPAGTPPDPPAVATADGPIEEGTAKRIEELGRASGAPLGPDVSAALRDPRTRFVVAGQQPGLLIGPLLALFKMLSLAALAESFRARTGTTILPLFWIASHDSDREEIDGVVLPSAQGEPATFRYPFAPSPSRAQVGELTVDPAPWGAFVDRLRDALPPNESRDHAIEAARGLVSERTTLAPLFARAARRLGRARGLLFFDGRDAEADPRGRSILAASVREAPAVLEALSLGARALAGAGWEPPLPADPARLPLFLIENGVRTPLFLDGLSARPEGREPIPLADLARRIEEGETRATPAAALRPIVQDAVFPNLGLAAGHSELLYHAELGPLYERLGVRRPALVPRASFYLLPRGSAEKLESIGIRPEDLAPGALPAPSADPLEKEVAEFVAKIGRETSELLATIDRAAPGAIGKDDPLRIRIPREAERTGEKLARLLDKAGENRRNRVHRLRNELFPKNRPQETVLSVFFVLARYGPEIASAIAAEVRPGEGTPQLLLVERGSA
jgi:bacillithiol biosynthesis cysteine-adding enzyme BshC